MTKELYIEISEWQEKTFGDATATSKLYHLIDEIKELHASLLEINDKEIRQEYADCFFLLFGSAAAYGMSFEDIVTCIEEKFEINKKRKWGAPDNNGVINHLK